MTRLVPLGAVSLLLAGGISTSLLADHHSKDVTGTRIIHRSQASGHTLEPQDLTSTAITAIVPKGSGGFVTIPGTGRTDGTFMIPRVPDGHYWFSIGSSIPTYVWTEAHDLDLDTFAYGRPDGVYPTQVTPLTMNITGLTPWTWNDSLQWYASNLDNEYAYFDWMLDNPPYPGDTALAGATLGDWSWLGIPLVDTTKGDIPSLTQLSNIATGNEVYKALTGIFQPSSLVQVDGTPAVLNGFMTPVPQKEKVRLAWDRTPYATYQHQVTPNVFVWSQYFNVSTQQGGNKNGFIASSADLLQYEEVYDFQLADLGKAHYGNPYPKEWGQIYTISVAFGARYPMPGASIPGRLVASLVTQTLEGPKEGHPMTQAISPVTGVTINGADAFNAQSSLQGPVTMTWNPPTNGSAAGYSVRVTKLYLDPDTKLIHKQNMANLITKESFVTVPPGILESGQSYVFKITAIQGDLEDPSRVPLRFGTALPLAWSEVLTAMVTLAP